MKIKNREITTDKFFWSALASGVAIGFSHPLLAVLWIAAGVAVSLTPSVSPLLALCLIAAGVILSSAWWVLFALCAGFFLMHKRVERSVAYTLWLVGLAFLFSGNAYAVLAFSALGAIEYISGFVAAKIRSLHK